MSRFRVGRGRFIKPIIVGLNQNGLYHKKSCRYYTNCEEDMEETKAIAAGHKCGACCVDKEN